MTETQERRREDWCRRYRLFPRVAFCLFLLATYEVTDWYIHLEDPSNNQAAFASAMVAASVGFFKFFMSEGKGE